MNKNLLEEIGSPIASESSFVIKIMPVESVEV